MDIKKRPLIHNPQCFDRDTLLQRQESLKFKNLARMELFLWNLEIFLQIQENLRDKVVLKGGAAAQFYIPLEWQRTSVDIDMVCTAREEDIERALTSIERRLGGEGSFFKARSHKPKDPKVQLPILTYYMDVPSVCTEKELFSRNREGIQEIKIEFHLVDERLTIFRASSPSLFAAETDKTYQILPLNDLIGDKLTTLGPNTIGIPLEREDEQIKQTYDIDLLIHFNWANIDFSQIKNVFEKRAKTEAHQRGLSLSLADIYGDMIAQIKKISIADFESDNHLQKLINNFQSLYIRKELNRPLAEWAIAGARIDFLLDCMSRNKDAKGLLESLFSCEKELTFPNIAGEEKGKRIRKLREEFSAEFERYSSYPGKLLKGKRPERILWTVVTPANAAEITSWIMEYVRKNS